MNRQKGAIERYLEAAEKTGDIMLRYQFQKNMIHDLMLTGAEREKLVEDVTDRVLSRISATVDVSEIIM